MDFDKTKFQQVSLPNGMLLHWVLNPGVAVNELLLGQRIPKVMLEDISGQASLSESTYIPCPHCHSVHPNLHWSKKGAFGNWFGYVCPSCQKIIPCLWNYTSLLILMLTFPIWGWFKEPLKRLWLARQIKLLQDPPQERTGFNNSSAYLTMGFSYGVLMFCIMSVPEMFRGGATLDVVLTQCVIWSIGGLMFGGLMKLFDRKH